MSRRIAFQRPHILALHRRVQRDFIANIERWRRGRYVWNPYVRRMIPLLEEIKNAEDDSERLAAIDAQLRAHSGAD